LTEEDKKVKSPYNTYLNPGLPPGPIANPGLASIKAVVYPKETEYWYYLHDSQGGVHYARTLEEHNNNIAKYLQ
ncbi:endolytic transglycosylase MltG, partial [Candidatus Gottesmanbacteria bacterium]|nr:endolytic transglycosylase MltG [Candidatus Gottesmanbacteria bacterium]